MIVIFDIGIAIYFPLEGSYTFDTRFKVGPSFPHGTFLVHYRVVVPLIIHN